MANTTSGTVTFDKTFAVDEIINEAYERIGSQVSSGYQLKTARRSLNILFQEWGNRGLHYWEVGDTDIDLVEGQAEYIFYRATGDGTSATTAGVSTGTSSYGIADVLEATYRTGRGTTSEAESALTKTDRATYSGLANKLSKGTPSRYFVQRFVDKTTYTYIQHLIQQQHRKTSTFNLSKDYKTLMQLIPMQRMYLIVLCLAWHLVYHFIWHRNTHLKEYKN